MEHVMKLYKENYDNLFLGKRREYRLNDEKRKLVKVGDTIKFVNRDNVNEFVSCEVLEVNVFSNWYDCYKNYFDEDFKESYNSVEEVVKETYDGYYSKELTDKYGCVVFTLSSIEKENLYVKK